MPDDKKSKFERANSYEGIKRAQKMVGEVIMPTPEAVLKAATLLSTGCDGESGVPERSMWRNVFPSFLKALPHSCLSSLPFWPFLVLT